MQQRPPAVHVHAIKYVGMVLGMVPLFAGFFLAAALGCWIQFFTHLHDQRHHFEPKDSSASLVREAVIATIGCVLLNAASIGMRWWIGRFPSSLGMSRLGWRIMLSGCSIVGFAVGMYMVLTATP